jgi:hypothetical protein
VAQGRLSEVDYVEFPRTYDEARTRFREAVARRGWPLESHPIAGKGPSGEDLTIDVTSSPTGDGRALVISSALHGVEGPLGSALQLAWLERASPAKSVVLIHGLNPYGYAWSRRFNEDNVDLNRNFLLADEAFQGCPEGYRRLNSLLNPEGPPRRDFFELQAVWRIVREGLPALKKAVAVGQYEFPRGLFFGGHGPSATQRHLAEHLPRWLDGRTEVVHIDVHTGLGRWGTYCALIDHPINNAQRMTLSGNLGPDSYSEWDEDGVAYPARGTLCRWCATLLQESRYLGLCLEFGTYSPVRVLSGLRSENQAHHAGPGPWTEPSKEALRELFCPASPRWRRRALQAGLDVIDALSA